MGGSKHLDVQHGDYPGSGLTLCTFNSKYKTHRGLQFYLLPTKSTPGDMPQEVYEQKLKQHIMLDSKLDELVRTRKYLSSDMLPKGLRFGASGFYVTDRTVMRIQTQRTSDQVD